VSDVRVTFNVNPDAFFDGYRKAIVQADRTLFSVAREVYGETTSPALERLGIPAPPVSYPIEWASKAQERAVKRKLRLAGNLPYKRSGAYEGGWTISLVSDGAVTRFLLTNPTAWAIWVGGSLSLGASARFQQKFHRNTGWQLSQPIAQVWASEVIGAVTVRFMARMRERVKTARGG
jgi:hypothetical protein